MKITARIGKVLLVGGTFSLDGGRPSSLVETMNRTLKESNSCEGVGVVCYNGGDYERLERILRTEVPGSDVVIWWPNVPNDLPKVRDVKSVNYKTMLITSKRNDGGKYPIFEIQQRNFAQKANLCVVFDKKGDGRFEMTLIDPLSNRFYQGYDVKELASRMMARVVFLSGITRQSTTTSEENSGALAYYFNQFKQEMSRVDGEFKEEVREKTEFIELVKSYANVFAEKVTHSPDVTRFLGNSAFRCIKGMPTYREGKYIFVTRRNVDKMYIDIDAFVPTYLGEDGNLYYYGDRKPSVDSPIQVRLYQALPNINYMIHAHCYVKNAESTDVALPCGAIEEVGEILKHIPDRTRNFYALNLKGHGMIIMGNSVDDLKGMEFYSRPELEDCDC